MRRSIGPLIVLLGLAAAPALAQKVTIDYAHDFDFSTVKTFQYVEAAETKSQDPLMDDRIQDAIIKHLAIKLEYVESAPDIYVTYHVTTEKNAVLNTTGYGYAGRGAGWRGWGVGVGSTSTTVSTYTEGTLVIDAYDAAEKKMVWRGTGTVTVKDNPEKRAKQIEKIIAKLDGKWQKILADQGK